MGRFMLGWVLVSMMFGVYHYYFSAKGKRNIRAAAWKVALSSSVGLLIIFGVMFLNNFSGL